MVSRAAEIVQAAPDASTVILDASRPIQAEAASAPETSTPVADARPPLVLVDGDGPPCSPELAEDGGQVGCGGLSESTPVGKLWSCLPGNLPTGVLDAALEHGWVEAGVDSGPAPCSAWNHNTYLLCCPY